MGLKIYVWMPANGQVGHASMTLSDGTHISWWPGVEKSETLTQLLHFVEAGYTESYEEDQEQEGRVADHIFDIVTGKLDEGAIKSWWGQHSDKDEYHILLNNCCSVVYRALKIGGATKYAAFPDEMFSTPLNVKTYVEKLTKITS